MSWLWHLVASDGDASALESVGYLFIVITLQSSDLEWKYLLKSHIYVK